MRERRRGRQPDTEKETTTCNCADSRRLDVTTTRDFSEHFSEVAVCAVVWPGREKVVWHRICEEQAFDLRSGNTLSLAVKTHSFQGLRVVSY